MNVERITNAYRSERLVYRAVESNDEDKKFLSKYFDNDPLGCALADSRLLKPRDKTSVEGLLDYMKKSIMALIICLSPDEAKKYDTDASEPIPIGYVVLGHSGSAPHHRDSGIGIMITEAYQNKGYGGESINWVLDWAFRHGGLHRVGIQTFGFNMRGQHLYKKLGFVEEGRSREAIWHDRKWYDLVEYGMLEREWANLRGLE
ncbi:GNAT family acetyltransferase acetyltransferase [Fusarium heterosporum]|uniref:GNAT family acetyltransferase acetyltransferase n=1 Tax=Fusarium heterosporum TaxID=42747 RepID=A0A8H5SUG3_FUSHE|nr:GNAT family acetyltransferase acetyltransferase [Fusarium heterosporum]